MTEDVSCVPLTQRPPYARLDDYPATLLPAISAFRALLAYLNTDVDTWLPDTHETIRKWIMRQYGVQREKVKQRIQSAKSRIHISCDLWTSPNSLAILGIVAHYVTEDGQLEHHVLGLKDGFMPGGGPRVTLVRVEISSLLMAELCKHVGCACVGENNGEQVVEQDDVEQDDVEQDDVEQDDVEQDDVEQDDVEQEEVEQEYAEQEDVGQEDVEKEDAKQEDIEQEDVEQEDVEQEDVEQENGLPDRSGHSKCSTSTNMQPVAPTVGWHMSPLRRAPKAPNDGRYAPSAPCHCKGGIGLLAACSIRMADQRRVDSHGHGSWPARAVTWHGKVQEADSSYGAAPETHQVGQDAVNPSRGCHELHEVLARKHAQSMAPSRLYMVKLLVTHGELVENLIRIPSGRAERFHPWYEHRQAETPLAAPWLTLSSRFISTPRHI
ncbi:hypothetical protein RJ55_02833 [Drechmeria coniospora]|nr:hypothetical protein RJ55_02833 [Drechmeria coniospora]